MSKPKMKAAIVLVVAALVGVMLLIFLGWLAFVGFAAAASWGMFLYFHGWYRWGSWYWMFEDDDDAAS